MLLTPTEVEITKLVVDQFLNFGQATKRLGLVRKARKQDILEKLSRWPILKLHNNQDYLPMALAFHFCGDASISEFAKQSVTVVANLLAGLFDIQEVENTPYTVVELEAHAATVSQEVDAKQIKLGLYLGQEFGFFSFVQTPDQIQVTPFGVSPHVIEINPSHIWNEYINRQIEWIEAQISGVFPPSISLEGENDSEPAQESVKVEYGGWMKVKTLSDTTGQSDVFLVRSPQRVAELLEATKTVQRYAGGTRLDQAPAFASAIVQSARADLPSELGALKVFKLRGDGPEAEQEALDRLKSEIYVLGQNKPGLLRLLAFSEAERWIITEYQPNGTLENQPSRFKGQASRALRAFRPLVEVAADFHREGIVHRDIKPANVFIATDGSLVLGDFGIVYLPGQSDRVTRTDERVGPYDYMPPWADLGERLEKVHPNFDVYMLGKLLWCMVAGKWKLPREYHGKPDFDLTHVFPDDPHMHIINRILNKCVVEEAKDCLPSAADLLLMVNAFLRVIDKGGSLVNDKIPRPCRVCGAGHYQYTPLRHDDPGVALRLLHGGSDWSNLNVRVFICDNCKHVEFFQPN